MPNILILAWGVLPAAMVVAWETARQRRILRVGFAAPVSTEGVRWAQYTGAAYLLGYAALALATIDGRSPALAFVVFCTSLTGGLMLWYLGHRYGSETPRLTDMREQCYRCRTAAVRRTHVLGRAIRHEPRLATRLASDLEWSATLIDRCDQQLKALQVALSTDAFVRRVRFPHLGRAEVAYLRDEQAAIINAGVAFLRATAPLDQPLTLCRQTAAR